MDNRCESELVEKLKRLAMIDINDQEACKYINEMREFMHNLHEVAVRYGDAEPLYYVWDESRREAKKPLKSDKIDLSKVAGPRLRDDRLIEYPWRKRR